MSASPFQLFDILNIQADKVVQVKYNRNQKRSQLSCAYYHCNIHRTEIIPDSQMGVNPTTAIYNCAADARRAELLRTLCSPGIGAGPQQAETKHSR